MKCAIAPVNLFWTPSSCSIISSARFSASSLISAAGWWMRATSSLMGSSANEKAPPGHPDGASWAARALLEVDALFAEVFHRARVPGHRRGVFLLVLELDVLGFLVRAHQVILVIEHRLHDAVRGLGVHVLVRDEQVVDRRDLVVLVHAAIDVLGDDVGDIKLAVLLVHRRHHFRVV